MLFRPEQYQYPFRYYLCSKSYQCYLLYSIFGFSLYLILPFVYLLWHFNDKMAFHVVMCK